MKTRRGAMKTAAGAASLLPVLNAQHEHSPARTSGAPYRAKWLTAAEMKLLGEVCELILPRTSTPGALDARVHEYIDFTLQSDRTRQGQLRDGLKWIAKAADRTGWLTAASAKPDSREGRWFTLIKDLTIDGYYQSREGLAAELGWKGNTYLPEFRGCTHPEHQG